MAGAWACVIHLDEGFAWLPQFCAPVFSVSFQPINLERGSGTLLQVYALERQFECCAMREGEFSRKQDPLQCKRM